MAVAIICSSLAYTSSRTFQVIKKSLNDFTEEPLLESIKKARFVTLFHDETTDVSNHSEAPDNRKQV